MWCSWCTLAATVVRSQPSFWEVHFPKVTLLFTVSDRPPAELLEASQLLLTAGATGPDPWTRKNTPGPGNSVVNYVHPIPPKGMGILLRCFLSSVLSNPKFLLFFAVMVGMSLASTPANAHSRSK